MDLAQAVLQLPWLPPVTRTRHQAEKPVPGGVISWLQRVAAMKASEGGWQSWGAVQWQIPPIPPRVAKDHSPAFPPSVTAPFPSRGGVARQADEEDAQGLVGATEHPQRRHPHLPAAVSPGAVSPAGTNRAYSSGTGQRS